MPKIKILLAIVAFALGWVMQDTAVPLLGGIGIGLGLAALGSLAFAPLGALGRLFVPYGLYALIIAGILYLLPPLPFVSGGPIGSPRMADIPPVQAWGIEHWPLMIGVGVVAGLALIGATVAYARAQCVHPRATHPKVALALAEQGRFDGFIVPHSDPARAIGGTAIPASPTAPARTIVQQASNTTQQKASNPDPADPPPVDPGWWSYRVPAPDLFEPLLAGLLAADVDFRESQADMVIRVPEQQRQRAEQVIHKLVGQPA